MEATGNDLTFGFDNTLTTDFLSDFTPSPRSRSPSDSKPFLREKQLSPPENFLNSIRRTSKTHRRQSSAPVSGSPCKAVVMEHFTDPNSFILDQDPVPAGMLKIGDGLHMLDESNNDEKQQKQRHQRSHSAYSGSLLPPRSPMLGHEDDDDSPHSGSQQHFRQNQTLRIKTEDQARSAPSSKPATPVKKEKGEPRSQPSTPKSGRNTPSGKAPRRRNSKQHNEEEYRRRQRIREKFMELRDVSQSVKSNQYNILCTAVDRIEDLKARLERAESDKLHLQQQLRQLSQFGGPRANSPNSVNLSNITTDPTAFLTNKEVQYHIPMALTTVDGHFVTCNDEFERLFGFSRDKLTQKSLFSISHRMGLQGNMSLIQAMLACTSDEEKFHYTHQLETQWVRSDNSSIPVHITASTVTRNTSATTTLAYFVFVVAPRGPPIPASPLPDIGAPSPKSHEEDFPYSMTD